MTKSSLGVSSTKYSINKNTRTKHYFTFPKPCTNQAYELWMAFRTFRTLTMDLSGGTGIVGLLGAVVGNGRIVFGRVLLNPIMLP